MGGEPRDGCEAVMRRLVAIGLDSADWGFMQEMMESGQLPHVASLAKRSSRCLLEDERAYRFGMSWTQFLSGRRAELTGDWDPMRFDPETYEASQHRARAFGPRGRPFYEADPSLRSIAFDVPHLSVDDRVNGIQVTSWGASASLYPRASRPRGVLREIDRRFGPHPGMGNEYDCGWDDPERIDRLVDALETGASTRVDISHFLQDRAGEWDLFLTVMSEPHSGGEFLWHGADPYHPLARPPWREHARAQLERVYRAVDEAVGRLAAGLGQDTGFLLFSPYGMRSASGDLASTALLPELLCRLQLGRGRLRTRDTERWRQDEYPPMVPDTGERWSEHMQRWLLPDASPAAPASPKGRLMGALDRARDHLRRRQAVRDGALGIPILGESRRSASHMSAVEESLEWQFVGNYRGVRSTMRSFAVPSFNDGLVRINLEGRDSRGIVPMSEYDHACREVEDAVAACRDPRTGQVAVAAIERVSPEDPLVPGLYADLVVHWARPTDAIEHPSVGIIGPYPLHRTGGHSGHGFLLLEGPGIPATDLGTRSVLDVAPTVLRLLGRSSAGFDGEALPVARGRTSQDRGSTAASA